MRRIAKVSSSIKLTARLSCNTNIRRYTSLVQVQKKPANDPQLFWSNLMKKRFYGTNESDTTRKVSIKSHLFDISPAKGSNAIWPIAVIDLNPLGNNSSKVLLIPLNWHGADENSMRTTITSLISKPKNLQQIEAFSEALKGVPEYRKTKGNIVQESKDVQNKEEPNTLKESQTTDTITTDRLESQPSENKEIFNTSFEKPIVESMSHVAKADHVRNEEEQNSLKESQISEISSFGRLDPQSSVNKESFNTSFESPMFESLDHVANAVDRYLRQSCLFSMQTYVDDKLMAEKIIEPKRFSVPSKFNIRNDIGLPKDYSIIKIDVSKLNLKDISWSAKIPFPENQISSLTNITLPISFSRKSYSTRRISLTEDRGPKTTPQNVLTLKINRNASSSSVPTKCNPNYDYPYLSKLFGTKELLMSCDAYNKALIEAEKRRAALAECTGLGKKSNQNLSNRPQVISIKGCSDPSLPQTPIKTSSPCPPPAKPIKQASNGCKKDDPCKPPQCPNPCKDEMEKLERLKEKEEEMKKKINKIPSGCESPKCKKEDNCSKLRKGPCKKATNKPSGGEMKSSSETPANAKQMADSCKKDDPCKPPECPNPCKDEMEKLKRLKDEEIKKNRNKFPSGCESPKCKKEDSCTKRKESPCKKASSSESSQGSKDSQEFLRCDQKTVGSKGKSDSLGKSKDKKQNNPCMDDHTEYKPKCNKDPCKQGGSPCGGDRKPPAGPSAEKKADSCGSGKKEDPCEKYNTKKDPCKMKDICGGGNKQKGDPSKKKESDPCGSKKEDPCKSRKSSPCGSRKDDPGKKEKDDPCKKPKEDPCKKKRDTSKSPCSSKKDDPCKKSTDDPCKKPKDDPCGSRKEDPCKKPKEDPCKKKRDSSKSPCGSKKNDPCKKNTDDPCKKPKDDPCKKKKDPSQSPCGSKKEDPCKKSKDDPCKKPKDDPCKKKKDSSPSPCGSKNEDPCKKSKDDPCKKKQDSAKSPCGSKKEDPCKKTKKDQCKKKKSSPCISNKKKAHSSKKKPKSQCKAKKDNKSKNEKSSVSKQKVCGKQKKETKPNCGQNKKCFSTSAATTMPSIRNKNWLNSIFTRTYSSKKKSPKDLGRDSQCKTMETKIPPKRKPAYNPHPKDGLRKCYPTYDMDCQQFCKDARKTDCRKYAFLKETDSNKRSG